MRIDVDTCRDPDLLAGEVRRLKAVIASEQTLTDKERKAIQVAINDYELDDMDAGCWHIANTLRGLLERTLTTHTNHDDDSVQESVT